jgi:hypothetical protein
VKRYGVEYCDEGGTLFDNDGNPIHHTWSVVDRHKIDGYGHPTHVSTCRSRRQAREEARELNAKIATPVPCHYCNGLPDSYEVNEHGRCAACNGSGVHPDGDDPHDDGEGWDGSDCGVCRPVEPGTVAP